MKRIIKTVPIEVHIIPFGAVGYDGMYDYIADESEDHRGALYVSIDTPVFGTNEEGDRVKVSGETVLVPPHASIKRLHTFAGWKEVGV